tara:strand:- start:354 stop:620 length:267 start_codon:yes stop_codon:yes gene_type:complete
MNIFGIGLPEIAVIAAIALIIFGPKRLPEFGRTLGKTLKGFQSASSEFEKEIQKAMNETDQKEGNSLSDINNQNSGISSDSKADQTKD